MCLSNEGGAVCLCIWNKKAGEVDGVSILLSCLPLAADLPKDVKLHLQMSEESWAGCCLEIRLQQGRQ